MTVPTILPIKGPDTYLVSGGSIDQPQQNGPILVEAGNIYTVGTTAPTAPIEGAVWADTSTGSSVIKFYRGGLWVDAKNTVAYRKVGRSVSFRSAANPAAAVHVKTISGLNIATSKGIEIRGNCYMTSSVAAASKKLAIGLKINSTIVNEADHANPDANVCWGGKVANDTGTIYGSFVIRIPRRDVGVPTYASIGGSQWCASEYTLTQNWGALGYTAGVPVVAITSIALRAKASPGTNCIAYVGPVYVFEIDES